MGMDFRNQMHCHAFRLGEFLIIRVMPFQHIKLLLVQLYCFALNNCQLFVIELLKCRSWPGLGFVCTVSLQHYFALSIYSRWGDCLTSAL